MIDYAYKKPKSLEEVFELLSEHGPNATLVAGGTDVLINIKHRRIAPKVLISLRGLEALRYVRKNEGYHIGALATHAMLAHSPLVQTELTALAQGAGQVGSVQLRNVATIGGNVCNAAPSADTAGPLLVFDALAVLKGPEGVREVPLSEFFTGPSQAAIAADEVLVELKIPPEIDQYGSAYCKHARRKAMNLPIVGVAVAIKIDKERVVSDARIGLTVVAPTPVRAHAAEDYLKGRVLDRQTLEEAGRLAASPECCLPRNSLRCQGWYREDMVRVLVPRVAQMAADQRYHRSEESQ